MKQYREYKSIQKYISGCLCDKCNNQINIDRYNAFEFNLECKTGNQYPEGGSGDKFELDLCEKCIDDFKKLLIDNGYRVQESEWDN